MKAAVLFEVDKPLQIEDVSVPNPGPREVLIRTRVAGLLPFRSALHGRIVPASAAAGVLGHKIRRRVRVEKVGSDVTYVKPATTS